MNIRSYIKISSGYSKRIEKLAGKIMNSEGMDIVSVIFLGIAVVIFLYLRSILGTKTDHERP